MWHILTKLHHPIKPVNNVVTNDMIMAISDIFILMLRHDFSVFSFLLLLLLLLVCNAAAAADLF